MLVVCPYEGPREVVSHAAPRHFADKEALLAAVAQEGFQMLHHTLETVLHKAPLDPLKAIAVGVAYVDFALEHSSHYRLMFAYGASAQQNPELAQAAKALMVLVNGKKLVQQEG